ncbi:MAG TPA: RNA polymerase sigma-54 factor, partial [Xanthobacteraceae bacterium]
MALTQRLEIRQSHALVMTPQLMQAIKLLQLSNLDLAAYVEGELERNPLLERAGEGEGEESPAGREASPDAAPSDWTQADRNQDESSRPEQPVVDIDDVLPGDADAATSRANGEGPMGYSEWAGTGAGGRENGDYNLEAFVSVETTLADHLAEQLALTITNPARRMIGQYLIDLVDEAGYLNGDLALVAEKLGAPVSEVDAVLAILQGFDPPGVCARNLTECLAIQLKERNRFDPAMQALVAHLDLLAKRDLAALRRLCGVGEEDLTDMIGEIRKLNPKPGLAFGSV